MIGKLVRMSTGCSPSEEETRILVQLYEEQLQHFEAHPEQAQQFLQVGENKASAELPPAQLAALTNAALGLFNYDKTLLKH